MEHRSAVIYNPASGRGYAERRIQQELGRLGGKLELFPTAGPNDATRIARELAQQGYARIIAAGGDGTAHEVANGILTAGEVSCSFATLPLGSMNDYDFALGEPLKEARPKPYKTALVDVGLITLDNQQRYFLSAAGVGFNGMVTLESRKIRRLRGLPLYLLAFLRATAFRFQAIQQTQVLDGKSYSEAVLATSVCIGPREGGFPVQPAALLDDGQFRCLRVINASRLLFLRYLPALMMGRLPTDHPKLQQTNCRELHVTSEEPLCIHADGEMVASPDDGKRAFRIELLPRRLLVEVGPKARLRSEA